MKITFLFLLILTGLSKCSRGNNLQEFHEQINKEWLLLSVEIDGRRILAKNLNECEYKDRLNIYKFNEILISKNSIDKIEGYIFGESNTKVCSINPLDFTLKIEDNSCPSILIAAKDELNRWYIINQGQILEYEVKVDDDKVILNLLNSVESWTDYTFSKMTYINEIK